MKIQVKSIMRAIGTSCMNYSLTLLVLAQVSGVYAQAHYIYPVGILTQEAEKTEKLAVVYQKGHTVELWLWDPESKYATKGLLSSYIPAGLRILPSKNAYSFIDNDRVRVKELIKRSTKAVDLYGPHGLSTIEWVDDTTFYFSAYKQDRAAIFYASIEGDLIVLAHSKTDDYLYPSLSDNKLFCIKKNRATQKFSLVYMEFDKEELQKELLKSDLAGDMHKFSGEREMQAQMTLDIPFKGLQEELLYRYELDKRELAFLRMINNSCGYFITYDQKILKNDVFMRFFCYLFSKDSANDLVNLSNGIMGWQSEYLFYFDLPVDLLLSRKTVQGGCDRLYESILPLLPVYHEGHMYFQSMGVQGLDLFVYSLVKRESSQISFSDYRHYYFCPLVYKEK